MKNIYKLLIAMVVLVSSTGLTKAQVSNWDAPWRGATHTYTFDVADNTNNVRWYVTTKADGTGLVEHDLATTYSFVTPTGTITDDVLNGVDEYSVKIQWGAEVPVDTDYFVWMEVDDNTSVCTNKMAVKIHTVATAFDALIADVTDAEGAVDPWTVLDDDAALDSETCPEDPENPINNDGGTDTYDAGQSTIVFRVERQFSLNAWNIGFEITEANGKTFTVEKIVAEGDDTGNIDVADSATGVINANTADNKVLVYVTVSNQPGVKLDLEMKLLKATTIDVTTNAADNNSDNNTATHTINSMPEIKGFIGS